MNLEKTVTTLLRDGFILVFNQDKLDIVKTAEALMQAGINNMEVTCRISDPLEKITQLRKALPEFVAGAASLVDNSRFLELYNGSHPDDTLPSVDAVVDAGANYLVSAADYGAETYQKYAGKLLMIPGCGTVSQIVSQFSLGANFI
ncbi:MAG: hypothetical protein GY794_06005, partial [bacterium]|nr:hypothetical protein [bacterium]